MYVTRFSNCQHSPLRNATNHTMSLFVYKVKGLQDGLSDILMYSLLSGYVCMYVCIRTIYPQSSSSSRANTRNLPEFTKSYPQYHRRLSPSAHLTKEHPALTVSCAPMSLTPGSRVGLTSTRSMATKLPVSCTHSAI